MSNGWNRREFLGAAVAATMGATQVQPATPAQSERAIPLGYDNFAIRAFGYKAPKLIDQAAQWRCDSLFITDLDALESFEPEYLAGIRRRAAEAGLGIHLGTWSICPTSTAFRDKWGKAEEHLALGIRLARELGSPVLRVVLGNGQDRLTPGGISARIRDTVKVLKSQKQAALDAGVRIAVENHAGDMQAWELAELVESAGADFVGVNLDSGNALWTMEDPLEALEQLGPMVLSTSLRDGMVWRTERGATVQWTAMGEGCIDWKTYFERFAVKCPGVPVHIETISGFPRDMPFQTTEHWKAWPLARARDFAAFLKLCDSGKPIPPHRSASPDAERAFQKSELERSLAFCRSLGLGRK